MSPAGIRAYCKLSRKGCGEIRLIGRGYTYDTAMASERYSKIEQDFITIGPANQRKAGRAAGYRPHGQVYLWQTG